MARHNLTFINRTGNPISPESNEDELSTIRSHAMREVRRRRGKAQKKTPPTRLSAASIDSIGHKDKLLLSASHWRSPSMSSNRAFSTPFFAVAASSSGPSKEILQHIHYFIHGFTPLTFPTSHIRHTCDILRVAASQNNLAVLHALCAVSTIHRALAQAAEIKSRWLALNTDQSKMGSAFLYHQQSAIVSLQMNLTSFKGLRDTSSFAVVILLLVVESMLGDAHTLNTHRLGLKQLLRSYGMGHEPSSLMSSDLLMSDIKAATTSLSLPSMSPCATWLSEFNLLKNSLFVPHRPELVLLGSGFMASNVSELLDPGLLQLFRAMRNLINAVEQNFDMGIDVSEVNGSHVLVLEHQLLSVRVDADPEETSNSRMSECCRIGALLYCNLYLWTWPKNTTLIKNLLSHFRTALSLWTPDPSIDEPYSVLLWLYFMGSFSSSNRKERQWYLTGMKTVSEWLEVKSEDDTRTIVAGFFFVDRLLGQHLTDCYYEIRK